MNNPYAEKALRAANKAAAKVLADALLHKRRLPIWKNGRVEHLIPSQEQVDELEGQSKHSESKQVSP